MLRKVVNSREELAEIVDVLFTSFPHPKNLLRLGKMKKGSILVDVSTIDPKTAIQISNTAQEFGVEFLACPLGKGPKQAYNGTVPLFVEGNKDTYKKVSTFFGQIGEVVPVQIQITARTWIYDKRWCQTTFAACGQKYSLSR